MHLHLLNVCIHVRIQKINRFQQFLVAQQHPPATAQTYRLLYYMHEPAAGIHLIFLHNYLSLFLIYERGFILWQKDKRMRKK